MDKVEIKVTWGFAWALFWRMFLFTVGIEIPIVLIIGAFVRL